MYLGGKLIIILAFLVSDCWPIGLSWPKIFRSSKPDNMSTPADYAASRGYYAESHYVLTPDGYTLGLHRVLSPTIDLKKSSPEPFILQHGMCCNSGQFVFLEPRQNIAFMLADYGFDVWMTNIRGNMFSRKHQRLSPDNAEFWNYSWFEHGTIDMPTIIDYILKKTKHRQVWYSGHSMGTTMFFVMTSMRPEYNKKIRHMFAMAPVAFMSHGENPIKPLAPQVRFLEQLFRRSFKNHLDADYVADQASRLRFCGAIPGVCLKTAHVFVGHNPNANTTVMQSQGVRFIPDAVSVGQMVHYIQLMNLDYTFRRYDYYEQNKQKYGSPEPPPYAIERITAPLTLMYSKNDYFAAVEDVETFAKALRQNVTMFLVEDPKFNHADFIISTSADELVYKPLLKMIDKIRSAEKRAGKSN